MGTVETFDDIGVGSRSSGAVAAGRLSTRARVLLLEEGPPERGTVNGVDLGPLITDPTNAMRAAWEPAGFVPLMALRA